MNIYRTSSGTQLRHTRRLSAEGLVICSRVEVRREIAVLCVRITFIKQRNVST